MTAPDTDALRGLAERHGLMYGDLELVYQAADTIDTLRAQLAEVGEDAERYRWLRGLDGKCDAAACVNFNIGFDWIEQHGDELDAAIDAARNAGGE